MWKAYKYTYYWLYTWQKKIWGERDAPEFSAVAGMSLSFLAIIFSIAAIIYLITDIKIILYDIPKFRVVIFLLVILGIHYLLFMHNGKYKEIEKEFSGENDKDRKRKGRWVLLYTFGSLAFFIFILFFGIWIKS